MQESSCSNEESSHKKKNVGNDGKVRKHCDRCKETQSHMAALAEQIREKDAIIEKMLSDRDVSLDASTGPLSSSSRSHTSIPGYNLNLENVITHQNIDIETLNEKLKDYERKIKELEKEKIENKKIAEKTEKTLSTQAEELQKLLYKKDKALKDRNENTETLKKHHEQELETITSKLQKSHIEELKKVAYNNSEKIKELVVKNALKESLLTKQVELLSNKMKVLYERDENYDTELQASRKVYEEELRGLRTSLHEVMRQAQTNIQTYNLPEEVSSLNNQLAEALSNEVTLKAELSSCRKDQERIKEELDLVNTKLIGCLGNEKVFQKELSHYKEENEYLNESLRELNEMVSELKEKHEHKQILLVNVINDVHTLGGMMFEFSGLITKVLREHRLKILSSFHEEPGLESLNSLPSSNSDSELVKDNIGWLLQIAKKIQNDMYGIFEIISNMDNYNKKLVQEVEHLKKELDNFRSQKCNEGSNFQEENEKLRSAIVTYRDINTELNHKYSELKIDSSLQKNLMEEDKKVLTDKLELYAQEVEELKLKNDELSAQLTDVKNNLTKRTEEKTECEIHLKHLLQQNSDLWAKLKNVQQKYSNTKHLESTPDSSDFNLDTQHTPIKTKRFSVFATSTPFPDNHDGNIDISGGGESPDVKSTSNNYQMVINWMEKCMKLEKENSELNDELEMMKDKMKEVEYGEKLVKEQILSYESRLESLVSKFNKCKNLKTDIINLTEENNRVCIKLNTICTEKKSLLEENEKLKQANILLEKKFSDYAINLSKGHVSEANVDILKSLNIKIAEVVTLKEELHSLQDKNKQLNYKLSSLDDIKESLMKQLEETSAELCLRQEEIEDVLQENLNLLISKQLLDKQVDILKSKVTYLDLKVQSNCSKSSNNLTEKFQLEFINLFKVTIEEKLKLDTLLLNKDHTNGDVGKLDSRHRLEILIKSNDLLKCENEKLSDHITEQISIIQRMEVESFKNNELVQYFESVKSNLIHELVSRKEQHARIEEALRCTGNLHNDLQKLKDEIHSKMREISSLQKRLEEERIQSKSYERMLKMLESDNKLKDDLLKSVIKQKEETEAKLLTMNKIFIEGEAKHKFEMKAKDWKMDEANLRLTNAKVDKALFQLEIAKTDPLFEEERLKRIKDIEDEYHRAIKQVRHYYLAQFAADDSETQERHLEQEKIKRELFEIESELNDSDTKLFIMLREKFEKYVEKQICLALARTKLQHQKHLDDTIIALTQLHSEGLELQRLKLEAEKYKEQYNINQENIKSEKDKMNSLTQTLRKEDKNCPLMKKLKSVLINDYFSKIQGYIKHWNKLYQTEFKQISIEIDNQLKEYDVIVIEFLKGESQGPSEVFMNDINKLFQNQNKIINIAQDLTQHFEEHYNTFEGLLEKVVTMCHEKVTDSINRIKSELSESNEIVKLQEEIENLRIEKDNLEKQHRATVDLLLADHQEELQKASPLLSEITPSNLEDNTVTTLDALRAELEEEHSHNMNNLREYFEKKCGEIKKQYLEEIEQQRYSSESDANSRSYGDLHHECDSKLEEAKKKVKLMESEIENMKTQCCIGGSSHSETCIQYFENIYKNNINENNKKWGEKIETLRNDLEKKYISKIKDLQSNVIAIQKSQQLDMAIQTVCRNVEKDYCEELNKITNDIAAEEIDKTEKKVDEFMSRLRQQYALELHKIAQNYEDMLRKEIDKVTTKLKKQEVESVWKTKLELEDEHKKEIKQLEVEWEKRLVNEMSSSVINASLNKVHNEFTKKSLIENNYFQTISHLRVFEEEMHCKLSRIQERLVSKENHIKMLENKLNFLLNEDITTKVIRSNELIEKIKLELHLMSPEDFDLELKNKLNHELVLIHQNINKKEECQRFEIESLREECKKEIERLTTDHEQEKKLMIEKYEDVLKEVQELKMEEKLNYESVRTYISKVVQDIRNSPDQNDGILPPLLAPLEEIFTGKYKKLLAKQINEHALEVATLKQKYDEKMSALLETFEVHKQESQQTVSFGNKDLDNIIKERDYLKNLTKTLKYAVKQLVDYLGTCEDELNNTVVDELIKVCLETPRKKADISISEVSDDATDSLVPVTPKKIKRVHFAPNVLDIIQHIDFDLSQSNLEKTNDLSLNFRAELDSCLEKLKLEAAAILGLSTFQLDQGSIIEEIMILQGDKKELLRSKEELENLVKKKEKELAELQEQLCLSCPGGKVKDSLYDVNQHNAEVSYLQDKARTLLSNNEFFSPTIIKIFEDLCREGDSLIEDARKERDDLQQQVQAADKQLKSTRQFLEEQACERENERDEYSREVKKLQAQLRERDKDCSNRERYDSELEKLEQQLDEKVLLLREIQEKKEEVEKELNAAVEKIWVLRDIISELEAQVSAKSEREAVLEKKLDELKAELEQQTTAQQGLAQEIEVLRNQDVEVSYLEQIQKLQENIKTQFNSSVVRQIKSQIREMEKALDCRTKELESLHVTNSNNSLSSPSEEISIREQLEAMRSKTPDYCPSPVGLPIEEVSKLQEKLQRHARAEEVVIRRTKDQYLVLGKLTNRLEEMQAEREVLQQQVEKQMSQLAQANNKIDDLRRKADSTQVSVNRSLVDKVKSLEEQLSECDRAKELTSNKLTDTENQLQRAQSMLEEQRKKLKDQSDKENDVVDTLRLELASVVTEKNRLESLLYKYRIDQKSSSELPMLMDIILEDKNEDIQHLQETVSMLRSQSEEEKSSYKSSKGLRVSFASDFNHSVLSEDLRLRDAPKEDSLEPQMPSRFLDGIKPFSPILQHKELDLVSEPEIQLTTPNICLQDTSFEDLKNKLSEVTTELSEKTEKISSLENQLEVYKELESDLLSTKNQLERTVASVDADKKYYGEQLTLMNENLRKKEEEICKLKELLVKKDEEVIKATGEIKGSQTVLESLQYKLKQARAIIQEQNGITIKQQLENLNKENNCLRQKVEEFVKMEEDVIILRAKLDEEILFNSDLNSKLSKSESEMEILSEELTTFRDQNEILQQDLERCKERLERYVKLSEALKKELSVIKEKSKSPKKSDQEIENGMTKNSSEVNKLQEEVAQLNITNKKFKLECNKLKEELSALKIQQTGSDIASQKKKLKNLEQEIVKLNIVIEALNKNHAKEMSNCHKENEMLQKKLEYFKSFESDTLELLKKEQTEKHNLQLKLNLSEEELDKQRRKFEEFLERINKNKQKPKQFSFSEVCVCDIPSGGQDHISSVNLLEQGQNEVDLSAKTDATLGILCESSQKESEFGTDPKCNSQNCESEKISLNEKLLALQSAMTKELDVVKELRIRLTNEDSNLKELNVKKVELESKVNKLQRITNYHEDRITQLSIQLDEEKNKVLTLELNLLKEKTNFKQLQSFLESETQKYKNAQHEDTQLIETLRIRLENSLESELKMRTIIQEAQLKMDSLEAQLNSLRAIEKYNSDSENENNKQLKKLLWKEKEKCSFVQLELEKVKRACNDLQDVIDRERCTQTIVKDKFQNAEQQNRILERELDELRHNLRLEMKKREQMEEKIKSVEEAEIRRSANKIAVELRNQQEIDTAHTRIRELEKECSKLKAHVKAQQDCDDKWRDDVRVPLLHQLNDVNSNLEFLVRERTSLRTMVDNLKVENEDLKRRIETFGQNIPQRLDGNHLQPLTCHSDLSLENHPILYRSVKNDIDHLMGKYIRAESYRKALVWQKRYLLTVLEGYQESHEHIIYKLCPINTSRDHRRRRFKTAVLVVIALRKMACLVRTRSQHHRNSQEYFLNIIHGVNSKLSVLGHAVSSSGVSSAKTTITPHSPPSRDIPSSARYEFRVPEEKPLLSPSTIAEYLKRFDEIQKRLGKSLHNN